MISVQISSRNSHTSKEKTKQNKEHNFIWILLIIHLTYVCLYMCLSSWQIFFVCLFFLQKIFFIVILLILRKSWGTNLGEKLKHSLHGCQNINTSLIIIIKNKIIIRHLFGFMSKGPASSQGVWMQAVRFSSSNHFSDPVLFLYHAFMIHMIIGNMTTFQLSTFSYIHVCVHSYTHS